jgi:hypothetical protein
LPAAVAQPRSRCVAVLDALRSSDDELGQVLAVLRAAGVAEPETELVAAGDRRLLGLYRDLAGRPAELTLTCGACHTVNSLELDPDSLAAPSSRVAVVGRGGGIREPTYGDLVGLPAEHDAAEGALLARLVVGAPARPPDFADFRLVDDTLAGPLIVECAGCGVRLEAPVDVERLVLELLTRLLARVDVEVHLLANAYGWSLEAIEALPDERRTLLADLVAEDR